MMKTICLGWMLAVGPVVGAGAGPEIVGPLHVESARRDAPALIVRPMTAIPLVAVRLSVRLTERPGLDGAVAVIQELARERLDSRAARLGARSRMERTPTHAVYEIVGPAEFFPEYALLLRDAVGRPGADARSLARSWNRYHTRALAELETPEPLVRRQLRDGLFPEFAVPAGENGILRPTPSRLEWFWATDYRPERMSAVVVGAVDIDAARSAFRDWPEPPAPVEPVPDSQDEIFAELDEFDDSRAAGPVPQVLFAWAGLGFRAGGIEAAPAALAAKLLERRLRYDGVDSPRAELWWSGPHRALVIMASARRPGVRPGPGGPGADAGELRDRLRSMLVQTTELLGADDVAVARAELEGELLMAARSPAGLARVIGTFHDRSGDPDAAGRFWASLKELDATHVRDTLLRVLAGTEVAVEVRP